MNENEQMNATVEPNNNVNMNYTQQTFQPKKKNNMIWLVPVILLLVAIAVALVWFMNLNKPENIYKKAIETAFDTYTEQVILMNDMESYKATVNLDLDVEFEEELVEEEILDLINETEAELGVQMNKKDKKFVVDMKADYDKEELLDLKLFADVEDKKVYLYAKEYIDKYLDIEAEEESFDVFEELFEAEALTEEEINDLKTAMNIMKMELSNTVKSEYCSAEKSVQKINGKDVNTTKNTIEMTGKEMCNEFASAFKNLKENEKFLKIFDEDQREEMLEILEDSIEELETMAEEDGADEALIQINTYTTGLMPKIVKVEFLGLEEDEVIISMNITKIDDKKSSLELEVEDETLFSGTLTVENVSKNGANIKFETEIEELGKFEVELGYKEEYNVKIDEIDEDNVATFEELTEDDQTELMENFEDSKFYEIIEMFSGVTSTPTIPSVDDITTPSIDSDDDIFTPPTPTTSTLEDNQILTYDSQTKVTFGIPSGYETDRISDTFQTIKKDDISIDISSQYGTEEEYYESLQDTKDYFLEQNYYKSVTLSEKKSTTIGGRTFYLATLETQYQYGDGKPSTYSTSYIWAKVSKNYLIKMEIDGMNEISASELEEILTLTVTEN